jgi:hypothetical protein
MSSRMTNKVDKDINSKKTSDLESQPEEVRSSRVYLFLHNTRIFIMTLITVLSLLSILHTSIAWPSPAQQQTLRFTKDGTFQVCIFEDLHYGEAEDTDWGPQQDINTTRVMNSVLNSESPQLVVLWRKHLPFQLDCIR